MNFQKEARRSYVELRKTLNKEEKQDLRNLINWMRDLAFAEMNKKGWDATFIETQTYFGFNRYLISLDAWECEGCGDYHYGIKSIKKEEVFSLN